MDVWQYAVERRRPATATVYQVVCLPPPVCHSDRHVPAPDRPHESPPCRGWGSGVVAERKAGTGGRRAAATDQTRALVAGAGEISSCVQMSEDDDDENDDGMPLLIDFTRDESRSSLSKIPPEFHSLTVSGITVHSSKSARDLVVFLDRELQMKVHVNKLVSICYYHLRRLFQQRRFVSQLRT